MHVDAEVVEDGRVLTGFDRNDFRILDEGKPQPIVQFSAGELPLDLILLFDISGSMRPLVSKVAAASRQALEELRPGDRVCVRVFNRRSREILAFSGDLEAVRKAIEEDVLGLRFGGGTMIHGSARDAARRFLSEPRSERRRAVLMITDNIAVHRRDGPVIHDFWEAEALLSGLIVSGPATTAIRTTTAVANPVIYFLSRTGMKGIAEHTGGDTIKSDDPGAAFQESMRRIRSRYSLYYAQPEGKPGAVRSVRVELTGDAAGQHPKAKVRARTGYVVPKN